jgi:Bacterial Ig domain
MKSFRLGLTTVLSCSLVLQIVSLAHAASLMECITNSQNANEIINSAPCGLYGIVNTRQENEVGNILDVTVQYMVQLPMGAPKAVVVLFSGGAGGIGIVPDRWGGVAQVGNNFLVRSAQLFAEDGFLTIAIDRPSDTVGFNNAQFDQFRVSPSHAQDIATVLSRVNALYGTGHLNVFLAGTSRGAISVTAQNMLGIGSMLSSVVTSPGGNPQNLWVGATSTHPRLKPDFVTVPVHILAHRQDGCFVSTPENSVNLHNDFLGAGVPSVLNGVSGGFELDTNQCNALTYHGYLGVEQEAVKTITRRMKRILQKLKLVFPGNIKPMAFNAAIATPANTPITFNLDSVTADPNGDPLRFSLPHDSSSRGGALKIRGPYVRYWPPVGGSNMIDGFVYRVFDGKGGTSNGVVRVKVN